ncbi:cytochrome b/b6 domain-containing protein [Sphingomonas pseudosanguinis]|uniref:Ni/Fe-hydrogenase b-type cytochrome subunit n=1 Tax=Sphingomonas pseudosanguinis TaxID=413712 RepID=A0A7W6ADX8_9SPHN|nr:cytochrome b/b6 domain-containing protein [Sphingomonas pseudosanguinis]MBB3880473.1 Ni/Fe-hydrogenase b-type cytochrome subunit [Sphingomonas pseudosanguinis]MBN3537310.1 cytochrome b/b6 domain-containing protein [Sphingomonas pseudosanguinis]
MESQTPPDPQGADRPRVIRRHGVVTRVWHWVNAVAVLILLGSGLGISNAHPRLYWGRYGANFDPAWATLPRFPRWLTIPANYNLAISRRWHLLFALVLGFGLLAYMIGGLVTRHFQRDLRIRGRELRPTALWADLKQHLAFRFHDPRDPRAYNLFQKLSYVLVLFVALPLAILTGIALSPGMNAAWPWVLEILGGRQSARSIHFITASVLALFTIVHLVLVILAGAGNEVRSMITGRWRVPE